MLQPPPPVWAPALKSPEDGWAVSPSAPTAEAISAFTSLHSWRVKTVKRQDYRFKRSDSSKMDMGPKLMNIKKKRKNSQTTCIPVKIAWQVDKYLPITKSLRTIHVRRCWNCIFHVTESALPLNLGSWKAHQETSTGQVSSCRSLDAFSKKPCPSVNWTQFHLKRRVVYRIWTREIKRHRFIHELSEPAVLMYQNDQQWSIPPKKIVILQKPIQLFLAPPNPYHSTHSWCSLGLFGVDQLAVQGDFEVASSPWIFHLLYIHTWPSARQGLGTGALGDVSLYLGNSDF